MGDKRDDRVTQPALPGRVARHPQRHEELAPGSRLGKYEVVQLLGSGGMGAVWEARDTELERRVALKLLFEDTEHPRLVREARAMARLRHTNVLTVYDVETIRGQSVIAMELIDGQPLATWLAQPHSQGEILSALLAAGRGLAAAHAAGIIHRDFKPHNVLIDVSGRVVVTDFGLARAVGETESVPPTTVDTAPTDRDVAIRDKPGVVRGDPARTIGALDSPLTAAGTVLGTPAYMAPEQAYGLVADERADQFSFCVTAWEALAGQRPFPGDSLHEIAAGIDMGPPWSVDKLPRRLRNVLARGLAREPGQRWPSIDALLSALERAWRRPRRIAVGLATITGLALVLLLVVSTSGRHAWAPHIVDLPAFEENSSGIALSPDGANIAYASDRERPNWYRIYISPLHGSEARALTPFGESYEEPRWTRDGKAVLATRWVTSESGYHAVRIPVDGGAETDLGRAYFVDDCGDTLVIAYVEANASTLALLRPDGSRRLLTSTLNNYLLRPRCDASGQHVLFSRGKDTDVARPSHDLFVIDRAGHEIQLTTDHASSSGIFTPRGTVVYTGIRDDQLDLYEIAATGGTPRRLTTQQALTFADDVSPDGQVLLGERRQAGQLVIAGGGNGVPRKLTTFRETLYEIVLSPDGMTLVAESITGQTSTIVAISIRDGTQRALAAGRRPFLSPDGTHVRFGRERALYDVPITGGNVAKLADLAGTLVRGSDGPDGVHLDVWSGTSDSWWHLGPDHQLVREDTAGLMLQAPHGNAVLLWTHDHGFQLKLGDRTIACDSRLPSWLDDHRFAYVSGGVFHIVDATTGAELGTTPGPDWGRYAVLAPDGVHWYDLQEVGHVTRHLLVNFGQR